MARRSIRDWIRRKSRGRKAMSSDMRELIDSFDAHKPSARPVDHASDHGSNSVLEAPEVSDPPSDAARSGTHG
jgi:hypothetical protein